MPDGGGRAARPTGPLLEALVAAAVAVPVLDGGGFDARPRAVFIVLAGLALVVALADDERAVLGALRRPAVAVLGLLGLLSVASVVWTIGPTADTARAGLVVCGYAALAAATAPLLHRAGAPGRLGAGLAVLAGLCAVIGLVAVAGRDLPAAERIDGAWRPGGPFQYPPALALLQVCALPVLVRGLRPRSRLVAVAAGAGLAAAGAVLALGGARAPIALAALVALALVLAPARIVGVPRGLAIGAVLLVVAAGAVALLVRGDEGAAGRTVVGGSHRGATAPATAGGGFTHGRVDTWRAAWRTGADRPLGGSGADTFLLASARHQGPAAVRYAHDLPLEAWAELGAGGLLLVLALYASAAGAVWRGRPDPMWFASATVTLAFLAQSLLDWEWHLAGLGAVFAVGLGLLSALPARMYGWRRNSAPRGRRGWTAPPAPD